MFIPLGTNRAVTVLIQVGPLAISLLKKKKQQTYQTNKQQKNQQKLPKIPHDIDTRFFFSFKRERFESTDRVDQKY